MASVSDDGAQSSSNTSQFLHYQAHLLAWSQHWYGIKVDFAVALAHEIHTLTLGYVRFHLRGEEQAKHAATGGHSVLVTFSHQVYGCLEIHASDNDTIYPLVPLVVVQQLASLCGYLWRVYHDSLLINTQQSADATMAMHELTQKQRELLRLLEGDISPHQIAAVMGIEYATVRRHLANLYQRLGVHSRKEASTIARAYRTHAHLQ